MGLQRGGPVLPAAEGEPVGFGGAAWRLHHVGHDDVGRLPGRRERQRGGDQRKHREMRVDRPNWQDDNEGLVGMQCVSIVAAKNP